MADRFTTVEGDWAVRGDKLFEPILNPDKIITEMRADLTAAGVHLLDPDSDNDKPIDDTESGHYWIRTWPLDGRWCERCGDSYSGWNGDDCPGTGAAARLDRELIAAREFYRRKIHELLTERAAAESGTRGQMGADQPAPASETRVERRNPQIVMDLWRPGSGDWGWPFEVADLIRRDGPALADLIDSIREDGVREPVLLGDDGRVWDGHHRIIAAWIADRAVPVKYGHGGLSEPTSDLAGRAVPDEGESRG